MMTRETGDKSPADLFHDIGASIIRHAASDDSEATLMRMSGDPLLLHKHLRDVEQEAGRQPWRLPVAHVQGAGDLCGGQSPYSNFSGAKRRLNKYLTFFGTDGSWLEPKRFVASEADFRTALGGEVNGGTGRGGRAAAPGRRRRTLRDAFVLLGIAAFGCWLFLAGFSG